MVQKREVRPLTTGALSKTYRASTRYFQCDIHGGIARIVNTISQHNYYAICPESLTEKAGPFAGLSNRLENDSFSSWQA